MSHTDGRPSKGETDASAEEHRKAAEEAIRDDSGGDDVFMSPEELGRVIDDLRSGRRPAILSQ